MNFNITLSSEIPTPLQLSVDNNNLQIDPADSLLLGDVRQGEVVTFANNADVRIVRQANNVTQPVDIVNIRGMRGFIVPGPGSYTLFPASLPLGGGIEAIIQRILAHNSPYDQWNICCNDYNEVVALLNAILAPLNPFARQQLLNTPIITFVPNQGNTEVTILESAIIMRWVPMVAYLLRIGANPNVTTAGVPFVVQLAPQAAIDPRVQAIIAYLVQAGAVVPFGFEQFSASFGGFNLFPGPITPFA